MERYLGKSFMSTSILANIVEHHNNTCRQGLNVKKFLVLDSIRLDSNPLFAIRSSCRRGSICRRNNREPVLFCSAFLVPLPPSEPSSLPCTTLPMIPKNLYPNDPEKQFPELAELPRQNKCFGGKREEEGGPCSREAFSPRLEAVRPMRVFLELPLPLPAPMCNQVPTVLVECVINKEIKAGVTQKSR